MFKLRKLSLLFILSPIILGGFSSVSVVTNPTIELNGPNLYILEVGTAYNELGATAEDAEDGVLTNMISITGVVNVNQLGNYNIQYAVTDSDSNTTIKNREVRVVDTTPPTITRTGNAVITLEVGDTYSEQSATATDNYDTSVSVVVGGDTVDTTTLGDRKSVV